MASIFYYYISSTTTLCVLLCVIIIEIYYDVVVVVVINFCRGEKREEEYQYVSVGIVAHHTIEKSTHNKNRREIQHMMAFVPYFSTLMPFMYT